jgi:hypothetical protein
MPRSRFVNRPTTYLFINLYSGWETGDGMGGRWAPKNLMGERTPKWGPQAEFSESRLLTAGRHVYAVNLAVDQRALRTRLPLRFGMIPSFLFDGGTTQRPRVKECITQTLCTKKVEKGEK